MASATRAASLNPPAAGRFAVLVGFAVLVNGGIQVIEGPAGSALHDTVTNGGVEVVFHFSQYSTLNNGTEVVWSGAYSTNNLINGFGFELVLGSSYSDQINSGGAQFVVSGGRVSFEHINSGGVQLTPGGFDSEVAVEDQIFAGGGVIVSAGGEDAFSDIFGTEIILSGGNVLGTIIERGGT
ncbi:MAG TPA: hypothetical protein VKB89_14695 [Xanthobacteraceae bacterium]|nr:hypothetical protein [Xanthobacteraceae bacterium]